MTPRSRRVLSGTVLLLLVLASPVSQGQTVSEAVVKAGFVYNFAKFTDWPPSALSANGAVQLCLTGGDPLGAVAGAIEGRTLQGHAVAVRRGVRTDELRGCHIVYMTDGDDRRQSDALRALRGLPVLTISDSDGFSEVGGMIGLVAVGDRIQFEVNAEVAQAAGLKISSQLLRLARTVRGRP